MHGGSKWATPADESHAYFAALMQPEPHLVIRCSSSAPSLSEMLYAHHIKIPTECGRGMGGICATIPMICGDLCSVSGKRTRQFLCARKSPNADPGVAGFR